MSELQIGLLVLGAAFIALVLGFNFYQEWRFKQKTRQSFAREHDDVLLDVPKNNVRDGARHDRLEPVIDDDPLPLPLPDLDEPLDMPAVQTVQAAAPVEFDAPEADAEAELDAFDHDDHQALVTAMLDPSLDFIAEIVFERPYELAALPRFAVAKRVQLIGRTERGLWKPAEALPGVRYRQLNVGLQLVDRSGALSEDDLANFCAQVNEYAAAHGARASFPQHQQKLACARELDAFCANVDILIGINIVPSSPIDGARLRSFAEAYGLELEPDGAFHYLSDSGNTLYSLTAADQQPFTYHNLIDQRFTGLTLLYDVPRVAGAVDVFDRAVDFCRQLAAEFDAELVDDNRRPLTAQSLARIRAQLVQIYGSMDDRGIAPGSVAALRLFA